MHVEHARLLTLAILLSFGCSADTSGPVEPPSGSMFGYYRVRVDLATIEPTSVTEVRFGGIEAYGVQADGSGFVVTVQGYPQSGLVDIEVDADGETEILPDAFEYLPAGDARFERIAAIGASLSQGVQNGVPSARGSLVSPPAQVARQLGGYMPLPILVDPLFPEMTTDVIGPPPACTRPGIERFISESAGDALNILIKGFQFGRVDPELVVHNVAVGGFKLENVIRGPSADMIGGDFIARLVYSPFETPVRTQLDIVEELEPTLVIAADLFGNDAIAPFVSGSGIRVSELTPLDVFESDLSEVIGRLSSTGAAVFVANMPRPSVLPAALSKKRALIERRVQAAREEEGEDEAQAALDGEKEADDAIEAVDQRAREYNQILADLTAAYDNVYLVDMAARTEELAFEGLQVGDTELTAQKFGGLLGLDSIHFTDTGYAVFANLFISRINEVLGTEAAQVDLTQVLATDRGAPVALETAGFDPTLCAR